MRNPQKIRSVRDNAAFVERVSKEHGGFGKFLADWPADDQVGLMAYLGKHGSRLGGNTGQYFLRWLGWDAFILSRDMARGLARRRPRHRREPDLEEAISPRSRTQINAWATETGLPRAHISRILAMSIGENQSAGGAARIYGRVSGGPSERGIAIGDCGRCAAALHRWP